jgi:hypothetical protein
MRPYLKKPFTKIGLAEWLKVKALSSSPSTTKTTPQNLDSLIFSQVTVIIGMNHHTWLVFTI